MNQLNKLLNKLKSSPKDELRIYIYNNVGYVKLSQNFTSLDNHNMAINGVEFIAIERNRPVRIGIKPNQKIRHNVVIRRSESNDFNNLNYIVSSLENRFVKDIMTLMYLNPDKFVKKYGSHIHTHDTVLDNVSINVNNAVMVIVYSGNVHIFELTNIN